MGLDNFITDEGNRSQQQEEDYERMHELLSEGRPEDLSPKEWIQRIENKSGVDKEEFLIAHKSLPHTKNEESKRKHPLWLGSERDYQKGTWAAKLVKDAAEDRKDKPHNRAIHYSAVGKEVLIPPLDEGSVMEEYGVESVDELRVHEDGENEGIYYRDQRILPQFTWMRYRALSKCSGYLNLAIRAARFLPDIDLEFDALADHKNTFHHNWSYGGESHRTPTIGRSYYQTVSPSINRPSVYGLPEVQVPQIDTVVEEQDLDAEFSLHEACKSEETLKERVKEKLGKWIENNVEFNERLQQPYCISVFSEKKLPERIETLIDSYDIPYWTEFTGQSSHKAINDLVATVNEAEKPCVLLYLADYDAAGDHMAPAVAKNLQALYYLGRLHERVVIDVALITREQIDEYELPVEEPDDSDLAQSREARLEEGGQVEINALEADMELFEEILKQQIERLRDVDLPEENKDRIEELKEEANEQVDEIFEERSDEIETLLSEADYWEKAVNICFQELIEPIKEYREAVNQKFEEIVVPALEEFEEEVEELEEEYEERIGQKRQKYVDVRNEQIKSKLQDLPRDITLDVEIEDYELPKGEAEIPEDSLFDTERRADENTRRVHKFQTDR